LNLEKVKGKLFRDLRAELDDPTVLNAMFEVQREAFVSGNLRCLAYENMPLAIAEEQTISQPQIVAKMISLLSLRGSDKVLEVGTGSGYQAAILSLLAATVVTTERFKSLIDVAKKRLRLLGYENVIAREAGDIMGSSADAPFDAIVVAAAAPRLPRDLLDQLASNGRMMIPVGPRQSQDLLLVVKSEEGYSVTNHGKCRFVPLVGPSAWDTFDAI
jgi:protein-L-isoaspartate(D-aspartate) O-methyltransferase